MLQDTIEDSGVGVDPAPMWAPENWHQAEPRWRTVDRALRDISVRRAALDADEARWLREAEALQIWRPLGMVSALDYLERVLGYAPRTAQDRLRVARALGALPRLTAALAGGALPFSAVRELTRVATPPTEARWVAAATGKNLRQIEELVADHRPGDRPDDPPNPRRARTRSGSSSRPRPSRSCARPARCSTTSTARTCRMTRSSPRCAAPCSTVHRRPSPPAERSSRSRSPSASAAAGAGKKAPARRSPSAPRRSSGRCAMLSTSARSTDPHRSERTRTFRRASHASSGVVMAVVAECQAAARQGGWSSIT